MVQPRRAALEIALLVALALFMTVLGPYATIHAPIGARALYWLLAIGGGGAIGIAIDALVGRRLAGFWTRVTAVSLLMTPPVTLLVAVLNARLMPSSNAFVPDLMLGWQVFVVSALVMLLRAYAWRRLSPVVETRTVVVPPLPEAEQAFRMRLSARRRTARLIALEAEDHYVRVHTEQGSELLSMRFAEAVGELERAHGLRVHRSWWVAADAVEGVRWSRGGGQVRLAGGLEAPVSRRHAAALQEAGWR